jgi:hypothetical protein
MNARYRFDMFLTNSFVIMHGVKIEQLFSVTHFDICNSKQNIENLLYFRSRSFLDLQLS